METVTVLANWYNNGLLGHLFMWVVSSQQAYHMSHVHVISLQITVTPCLKGDWVVLKCCIHFHNKEYYFHT